MKVFIISIIFVLPTLLYGQIIIKKSFYTKIGQETDSIYADKIIYSILLDSISGKGILKTTSVSGNIISEIETSNINSSNIIRNGFSKEYYENEQLKYSAFYVDEKLDGELTSFYNSGKLKRKDLYNKGELVKGNCYTECGNDTAYFDFIVLPKYCEGNNSVSRYISSTTKYPKKAKRKGIFGKVIVQFTVDINGKIVDSFIFQSIDPLLDEEALRVVRSMKDWMPGYKDGEISTFSFQLPINFKLN